jgi:hypothetical protein
VGSHGRGTAEGQRDLLGSLGVTEEKVRAPVLCSVEVVESGESGEPLAGLPVQVAREASMCVKLIYVYSNLNHQTLYPPTSALRRPPPPPDRAAKRGGVSVVLGVVGVVAASVLLVDPLSPSAFVGVLALIVFHLVLG